MISSVLDNIVKFDWSAVWQSRASLCVISLQVLCSNWDAVTFFKWG